MGLDHTKAVRILALHEVVKANRGEASADYVLRKIYMWYSEKFHTPLHIVDTLLVDYVLRAYYEYGYDHASDETIQKELWTLTRTDDEVEEAAIRRDEDDVYFHQEELATIAEEEAKAKADAEAKAKKNSKMKQGPAFYRRGVMKPQPGMRAGSEPELPDEPPSPPEIKMTFISEAELERLIEQDDLGDLPPLDDSLLGLGED